MTKHGTALHEAAHAVVAHHLGYLVTSIVLRGDWTGHIRHLSRPVRGRRPLPPRPCPVESAMIELAGDVAEHRAGTLPRRVYESGHLRTLEELAISARSAFKVVRPATDTLLRQLWPEVARVAADLRARRWPVKLRRRQVELLLGEA